MEEAMHRIPFLVLVVFLCLSCGVDRYGGLKVRAADDIGRGCVPGDISVEDIGAGKVRAWCGDDYADYVCTFEVPRICVLESQSAPAPGPYASTAPAAPQGPVALSEVELRSQLQSSQFLNAIKFCTMGTNPPKTIMLTLKVAPDGLAKIQAIEPMPPTVELQSCIAGTAKHLKFRASGSWTNIKYNVETGHEGPDDWSGTQPPAAGSEEEGEVIGPGNSVTESI
jgi:hypothetical protein